MAIDKLRPKVARKPEVLAPAGDPQSLRVALQAGADAVYFGLDEGFNARLRATNFSLQTLPDTVATIHRAGARAYLTLNTLVFEPELPLVERLIRAAAEAGVDALIVQDPAVALLARRICPALHLHASTQMTISSAEAARFAQTLQVDRVVVPRELSVAEIRRMREGTDVELEVFILGALCVSWSGQCLSSEAWGGRSANRGQCAQACRLPYDLVVDGETRPLGDVAYLLSPRDLAGFRAVSDLMEIGVQTLKIEGRQKGAGYVHAATRSMRRWVDALARGADAGDVSQMARDVRDLSLSYSRGFSDGWLAGSDHQTLVEGRFPRHRGILLGRVVEVYDDGVRVTPVAEPMEGEGALSSPLPPLGGSTEAASGPAVAPLTPQAGMGVVFDEGHPERDEEGGPIFAVERIERGAATGSRGGHQWVLRFGRPGPDLRRVSRGARVWITGDPALQNEAAKAARAPQPSGRVPVALTVRGSLDTRLHVTARLAETTVEVESESVLQAAQGAGLDESTLRDKLCAFGGTPISVATLDPTELAPGLFLPVAELKRMRRTLLDLLNPRIDHGPPISCHSTELYLSVSPPSEPPRDAVRIVPLCRNEAQLDAVIASGLGEVVLDWMELVGLGKAVERARAHGLRVGIATVRVQKPGEEGYDRRIARLRPDEVLVRHWGGVMHFRDAASVEDKWQTSGTDLACQSSDTKFGEASGEPKNACQSSDTNLLRVHGDFSLNVTNSVTARHLLGLGLETVTASHDLDEEQLMALLDHVPCERVAVTIHHHIPTFHTEHCVYSNTLSKGRDFRSCGRPCEAHGISLRDRVGLEHPVIVDVGCRNTVFNAAAQSAASLVPRLVARGVRLLRVEFVRETREEAAAVLAAYRALVDGVITAEEALRRVGAHEQFGVSKGTMQVLR